MKKQKTVTEITIIPQDWRIFITKPIKAQDLRCNNYLNRHVVYLSYQKCCEPLRHAENKFDYSAYVYSITTMVRQCVDTNLYIVNIADCELRKCIYITFAFHPKTMMSVIRIFLQLCPHKSMLLTFISFSVDCFHLSFCNSYGLDVFLKVNYGV